MAEHETPLLLIPLTAGLSNSSAVFSLIEMITRFLLPLRHLKSCHRDQCIGNRVGRPLLPQQGFFPLRSKRQERETAEMNTFPQFTQKVTHDGNQS